MFLTPTQASHVCPLSASPRDSLETSSLFLRKSNVTIHHVFQRPPEIFTHVNPEQTALTMNHTGSWITPVWVLTQTGCGDHCSIRGASFPFWFKVLLSLLCAVFTYRHAQAGSDSACGRAYFGGVCLPREGQVCVGRTPKDDYGVSIWRLELIFICKKPWGKWLICIKVINHLLMFGTGRLARLLNRGFHRWSNLIWLPINPHLHNLKGCSCCTFSGKIRTIIIAIFKIVLLHFGNTWE